MNKVFKQLRSQIDGELKNYVLTNVIKSEDKENGISSERSYWTEVNETSERPEVYEFVCTTKDNDSYINYETLDVECLTGTKELTEEDYQ